MLKEILETISRVWHNLFKVRKDERKFVHPIKYVEQNKFHIKVEEPPRKIEPVQPILFETSPAHSKSVADFVRERNARTNALKMLALRVDYAQKNGLISDEDYERYLLDETGTFVPKFYKEV